MAEEVTKIFVWVRIIYDLLILISVAGVIYWAVKNGQFTKQKDFSRLPLDIDNSVFNEEED